MDAQLPAKPSLPSLSELESQITELTGNLKAGNVYWRHFLTELDHRRPGTLVRLYPI